MGLERTGQQILENLEITADQLDLNTDELESLLSDILAEVASGEISSVVDARLDYVESADVDGTDYVSGSEGSVKQIEEGDSFNSGDQVKRTTFYYRDSSNPTSPTEIDEEIVTL